MIQCEDRTGRIARFVRRLVLWAAAGAAPSLIAAAWLMAAPVAAAPRIPTDDGEILERLPAVGPAARETRLLAMLLNRSPNDLPLALRLARRNITLGQSSGDPRFFGHAEAALGPWAGAPEPPADVLLLRGVLRQNRHDFDGALDDLGTVIARAAGGSAAITQARLTRAAVHMAQANYEAAKDDCAAAAAGVPRPAAIACTAGVASLTGHAHISLAALKQACPDGTKEITFCVWALTLSGEIAARLNETTRADADYARARALAPDDAYLLGSYADLLLDTDRLPEAITLLSGSTRVDPLLLRLAEAERRLGKPNAVHEAQLAERFETSRRRGETVHTREESRFALHILNRPAAALDLAERGWKAQREPADARILLEAAIAAGRPASAAPALEWIARNGVESVRLAALAAEVKKATPIGDAR